MGPCLADLPPLCLDLIGRCIIGPSQQEAGLPSLAQCAAACAIAGGPELSRLADQLSEALDPGSRQAHLAALRESAEAHQRWCQQEQDTAEFMMLLRDAGGARPAPVAQLRSAARRLGLDLAGTSGLRKGALRAHLYDRAGLRHAALLHLLSEHRPLADAPRVCRVRTSVRRLVAALNREARAAAADAGQASRLRLGITRLRCEYPELSEADIRGLPCVRAYNPVGPAPVRLYRHLDVVRLSNARCGARLDGEFWAARADSARLERAALDAVHEQRRRAERAAREDHLRVLLLAEEARRGAVGLVSLADLQAPLVDPAGRVARYLGGAATPPLASLIPALAQRALRLRLLTLALQRRRCGPGDAPGTCRRFVMEGGAAGRACGACVRTGEEDVAAAEAVASRVCEMKFLLAMTRYPELLLAVRREGAAMEQGAPDAAAESDALLATERAMQDWAEQFVCQRIGTPGKDLDPDLDLRDFRADSAWLPVALRAEGVPASLAPLARRLVQLQAAVALFTHRHAAVISRARLTARQVFLQAREWMEEGDADVAELDAVYPRLQELLLLRCATQDPA